MKPKTKDFNFRSGKKYDGMMGRCYRQNDPTYPNYGGRGIKVCSAWIKDINAFRRWLMLELQANNITIEAFTNNSKYYQLDRIDTDGHYEPNNCRIATPQTNSRNRRIGVLKTIQSAEGETITLK